MNPKLYTTDVVVVGGGIAGITAAIELLDYNKKVLLLERGNANDFGGLAIWSFGGMFFVDTPEQRRLGIKDSPEIALRDWHQVAHFEPTDTYPKQWAHHYINNCTPKVYRWLKKKGIKFFPVVHWVERGQNTPGNSYPRFHIVWGTGYGLTQTLIKKLLHHPKAKSNLQIGYQHLVKSIEINQSGITGVIGEMVDNQQKFIVQAQHTVIASGGMGGNLKKVRDQWYQPWGEPPQTILNGANAYADGMLHDAAKEINAHITHLDKNWPYAAGIHHPKPRHPQHGLSLVPCKSALWLNYKGQRIGPEPLVTGYDTRHLVESILKQDKKYSWQILNKSIAYKEFAISGSEHNEALRDKKLFGFLKNTLLGNRNLVDDMVANCVDFVTANSLEELVDKMNALQGNQDVQLEAVKNAVEPYDEMIGRPKKYHNDEQLRRIAHARQYKGDKVRTCKFQKIDDKKAYPLIAIRLSILSRKTLGGIQTNLNSQVLSTPNGSDQDIIKNLYAIGEAAGFGGGGSHGIGTLEGTFLGTCILTAREAAAHIANKTVK